MFTRTQGLVGIAAEGEAGQGKYLQTGPKHAESRKPYCASYLAPIPMKTGGYVCAYYIYLTTKFGEKRLRGRGWVTQAILLTCPKHDQSSSTILEQGNPKPTLNKTCPKHACSPALN